MPILGLNLPVLSNQTSILLALVTMCSGVEGSYRVLYCDWKCRWAGSSIIAKLRGVIMNAHVLSFAALKRETSGAGRTAPRVP